MEISKFEIYDNVFELLKDYYTGDIYDSDLFEFINYLVKIKYNDLSFLTDYIGIIDNLWKNKIDSFDFLNTGNIGYDKQKKLIYFDIGFGEQFITEKPNYEIDLSGTFYFENEMEIFETLGFKNLGQLGFGANGTAYNIGNKVLKITADESEVYNSLQLLLKETNHLNYIHDVYEFTLMGIQTLWCIIQDKLIIDKIDLGLRLKSINKEFQVFKSL